MKIKNKILTVVGAMLLASILLVALLLPIDAARLDYSSLGATNKTTLSSADILSILFSDDPEFSMTAEEREYLEAYGTETVTYGENIPASAVTSEYNDLEGVLKICAKEYKYRSVSGVNMTWTPTRVEFDGREEPLANDGAGNYRATFEGVDGVGADTARVIYSASITFSEDVLNALLNKAYSDGAGWTAYKAYVLALAEYKTSLALYRQYLIDKQLYNDRYKEYTKYLADKAVYDEAYAKFLEYEAALAQYNAAHAAYVKYLAEKEEYDKNVLLYNNYVKNIKTANEQIKIMLDMNKGLPTIGRPLVGAILGPTVEQVVNNKDAIANELTGVDGAVIDLAGECTERIRKLLTDFFSLTSDADRYTYYAANYEPLRYNFTTLFQVLDYLYENDKVRYALNEMDMKEKYQILLAQLFYAVNALNDTTVSNYEGTAKYNSSYRINRKTPLSIVEGVPYIVDTKNAKPLENGYPVRVEEPVAPTRVDEPTKPTAVAKPVAPTEVSDPGSAPAEVALPTSPIAVAAPNPSVIDGSGKLPDGILVLIDAYAADRLIEREPVNGSKNLILEATATKKVLNADEITVNFYSYTGTLLSSVKAERGTYVEYEGDTPTRTSPDKIYTFIGWCDADGNAVDMSALDPDGKTVDLYPAFSEADKTFSVVWSVDGTDTTETYKYGEMPVYSGAVPQRADEGSYLFVFDGWDSEIGAVTSDKTYTARFQRLPIIADSNGLAGEIDYLTDPDAYVVDLTASLGRELELENLLIRAISEMKGIVLMLRDAQVRMSFSEASAVLEEKVTRMRVSSVYKGEGENLSYTFYIRFYSKDGKEPETEMRASVTFPITLPYPENTEIYYLEDGESVAQRREEGDGTLTLVMYSDRTYYSLTRFSVDTVVYDGIELDVDKPLAGVGERVRVNYVVPDGVRVLSLYYVGENGVRVEIDEGAFEMPLGAVSVGLEYRYLKYTVRFASDGKIISSAEYLWGEIPTPPTPYKAADASYEYVFVGWDKEIVAADGNEVYNAVYEKKLIEREPPKEGLQITDRVLKIIMLVGVVVIYGVGVALPVVIAVIVKLVISRRKIDKNVRKSKK